MRPVVSQGGPTMPHWLVCLTLRTLIFIIISWQNKLLTHLRGSLGWLPDYVSWQLLYPLHRPPTWPKNLNHRACITSSTASPKSPISHNPPLRGHWLRYHYTVCQHNDYMIFFKHWKYGILYCLAVNNKAIEGSSSSSVTLLRVVVMLIHSD